MESQLSMFLDNIVVTKAGCRRRTRTICEGDVNIASRRLRVESRNKMLVLRYYYWTEIRRRRYDDVLKILSDSEFYVEDRTINNALVELDDYYLQLLKDKPSQVKLARLYPSWNWR